MNEHELSFIRTFLPRNRQDRYLFLLSHGRRAQFLAELDHKIPRALDLRRCAPVHRDVEGLIELVSEKYSGDTCYVIGGGRVDGMTLDYRILLREPLDSWFECILSCLPGKLALFIHDPKEVFLCEAE